MSARRRVFAVVRGFLIALALLAAFILYSILGQRIPWISTALTLGVVVAFVLLLFLGRREGGFIVEQQD